MVTELAPMGCRLDARAGEPGWLARLLLQLEERNYFCIAMLPPPSTDAGVLLSAAPISVS